ncbi:MAG: thioesterase family protein [Deltaproteobacteria bacterium]|nr:thioesterase family protein [Deltaproteobacteria bacterium]
MITLDQNAVRLLIEFMEEQIPFNKHLGLKCTALEEGKARLEIPFQEFLIGDPFRPALHGGVISTLADTCGGAAVFSLFDNVNDRTSTVDLRVDYLRPGLRETLIAEAEVIRAGNKVAVVDVVVFHPDRKGEPVATAKAVYNLKRASEG